ncbi:MAG: glutamate 5-kinase [Proteobacteria bacterium]|nr:MAG: glutamate 5-kinase [Pseudomonadota bacterium]
MKNQERKKRIVIKVGTHVLSQNGKLCKSRFEALCAFLAKLSEKNEVILVSSAAIVSGYSKIRLDKNILANRQALAAVGQPELMRTYSKHLKKHGKLAAQILISGHNFDSRSATAKAKSAIDALLKNGIIPIINENDATATDEIVFGDNDQLSSRVAYYFDAYMLVILSDIDGYYDKDPKKFKNAKVRKIVSYIKEEELRLPSVAGSEFGTGGIVTKLKAAHFLLKRGKKMFMSSGFDLSDIESFMFKHKHKGGTLFVRKPS